MGNFETAISLTGPDAKVVVLKFVLTEHDDKDDEVTVEVTYDGTPAGTGVWHVEHTAKKLQFDIAPLTVAGQAVCLAACLGGSVGATLADCMARAKNRAAVRRCFREHAPGALVSSISCVVGCLSTGWLAARGKPSGVTG